MKLAITLIVSFAAISGIATASGKRSHTRKVPIKPTVKTLEDAAWSNSAPRANEIESDTDSEDGVYMDGENDPSVRPTVKWVPRQKPKPRSVAIMKSSKAPIPTIKKANPVKKSFNPHGSNVPGAINTHLLSKQQQFNAMMRRTYGHESLAPRYSAPPFDDYIVGSDGMEIYKPSWSETEKYMNRKR